ncbi:MAG: YggS family pyridoxal phosphate-dependent enzyme [Planctomycetes bacterium]|nr:YggS family pyridoxal phosphate-dependent enzyme [Planctomycetota bacterium]
MGSPRFRLDLERFERNIEKIRDEVAALAPGPSPTILPVTKYLDSDDCRRLHDHGYGPLGENRADALVEKAGDEPNPSDWHFIGHLQRNKISRVLLRISLLHSLDNERLASEIEDWGARESRPVEVLVQVNISGEMSKGGLTIAEARAKIPTWTERFRFVRVRGLMTMAPLEDPEASRPCFRGLRELRDDLRGLLAPEARDEFSELSMGMSNDYRIATLEGATLLRLGQLLYE